MSQQEDDLRALAKIMDFLRAVSIILVVMNVYWFCYEAIRLWGVDIGVVDRILMNFNRTAGLFHSILYTKLFAVLLLALSCLGTKGVKGEKITWGRIWTALAAGFVLFFLNWWILALPLPVEAVTGLYALTVGTGYVCLLMGGLWMSRLLKHNLMDDVFNNENESFMQETRLIESEYSVNLPTRFYYRKRWNNGWINVVNPFRASIVLGTPGSGKSYAVVNSFIKQQIEKGFSMYVYDFKFSDLSTIAYNHLLNHPEGYKVKPKFYVINFDDPRRSHRCNPIHPDFMEDITDAYESAYTIMLNLNKSWVQKQGDFFVESPIILFAAIIWYLKIFQNGKYCTFPHAIEFLNRRYEDIFPILTSYPELENYLSPFMDAWLGGAAEQLMGQIASAKIPLSRMISPQLYWVMSDSEFTLDINNPEEPKILCVGNNPDRQNIYGAALGLYNSRIVKLINKKGMLKSSVIIDELPTIYFKGLDNLIATARSNKVAVCLGFQDFSQLVRDYGDREAKVVMNTVGNIFSGQVVGEDIAARKHRKPLFLQHGRAQAGCRGLAAGPGHAEHRLAGKLAPCQFGFGHDFRRGAVGQKFADDRSGHTGARHDQLRIPELARGMFAAYDFHSRGLRPFREISRDAIQRAIQQPHPRTKLVQQFGGGHAGNPGSHNNREVARFHRRCRLREHFVCSFHHDSRMMPPAARGTAP